jgi:hypothetical protein
MSSSTQRWRRVRLHAGRLAAAAALGLIAGTFLVAAADVSARPARATATGTPDTASTPADKAATMSYLQAGYQLAQTLLRNASASRSAVSTLTKDLGHECHGVLAGAPHEGPGVPTKSSATPRARGERQRGEIQLQTIEEELELTVVAAVYQPDRGTLEVYSARIETLSWSDPRIAPLARFDVDSLEERAAPPVVDMCSDMETWAQSGYHLLSAASREFDAAQKVRSTAVRPGGSISSLLKPYEGPRERALIRRTRALQVKTVKALSGVFRGFSRLRRTLGVPGGPFEERKREPVLGRGTTHAGSSFTVRRESPGGQFRPPCGRSVSVELKERAEGSGGSSGSSATSVCLGGHSDRPPSSSCGGEIESITTAVPASVSTVRLRLSNGETITSGVVRVPTGSGGPGGIYVQAIRGYSPYPVSLEELNAQRDIVLVVAVKRLRCKREPAAQGPTFVDLANGTTPGGEAFAIEGVVVHFGSNQTSFSLELGVGVHGSREGIEVGNAKPKAFSWSLGVECPPHEFAIVYGILSAPGDSVLARTPAGLVPLTEVAIAGDLHSEGPLAYGVFSTLPSELVVRDGNGSTVYTESLIAKGREEAEFCQGYAEA